MVSTHLKNIIVKLDHLPGGGKCIYCKTMNKKHHPEVVTVPGRGAGSWPGKKLENCKSLTSAEMKILNLSKAVCSWCVYHQPCESQMAECMDPKQLLYIIFRVKCKSWKIFLYGAPGVRVYMHIYKYIYIYMNRYFIYQKGILIHQTNDILEMFGNV